LPKQHPLFLFPPRLFEVDYTTDYTTATLTLRELD